MHLKEAITTHDIRERKKDSRIKSKGGVSGGHAGKDVRHAMTVKLQRELLEKTHSRGEGGADEAPPEAEAVAQTEESAADLAGGVRERVASGIAKATRRKREKWKAREEKPCAEQTAAPDPTPEAEDNAPPLRERPEPEMPARTPKTRQTAERTQAERKAPAPKERMRREAIKERRDAPRERPASVTETPESNGLTESEQSPSPPTPKERMRGETLRERQTTPRTRPTASTTTGDAPEPQPTPPAPKERMRSEAIRERQTTPRERPTASVPTGDTPEQLPTPPTPKERMQGEATRERQVVPGERHAAAPDTTSKAPTPQERGRQKAVTDARARYMETRRELAAPRIERPTPQTHSSPASLPEKKDVSLKNQSINQSIRERPRHAAKPKEKPAGGAFSPKTRRSVKAPGTKAAAPAAKGKGAKQAAARAKLRFQRNAQRKLLQQANQRAAKRAAELARRAAAVIVKSVTAAVGAVVGLAGSAMLLPVILVIALVAAIVASPFGIFFSSEPTPGAMPLNVAVGQLNMELSDKLEEMQAGDYDSIDLQGTGPDWREVVAVFAVKTAGADDGVDVAALTPDRVDRIKAVFWDMCAITSTVETIDHPGTDGGEGWTEKILHLTVTPKSADDMRTEYHFNERQNAALTELLAELSTMEMVLTDLTASQEQARELLRNLPFDLDPERRAVVETACQLVGKVAYFWGGKSLVLGWDSRWGTIQKVWADGNSTTSTYRPYGLDCSGFADWTFYNASGGAYVLGHGGGASMQHTYCTPITWADAIPGDLVFYPGDEHVGIVGGRDADGNLLIIHCASSYNCVVITSASGFTSVGRPTYYAAH